MLEAPKHKKRAIWMAGGFVVLTWVCMGLAISVEVQQKHAAEEGWSAALDLETKLLNENAAKDDKYWALVARDEKDADTRRFLFALMKKPGARPYIPLAYDPINDERRTMAAESEALSAEKLALTAETEAARRAEFSPVVTSLIQSRSILGGHFEQRPSTVPSDEYVTPGSDPKIIPIYDGHTEPVWVPDPVRDR
jgi:hypothetical protein